MALFHTSPCIPSQTKNNVLVSVSHTTGIRTRRCTYAYAKSTLNLSNYSTSLKLEASPPLKLEASPPSLPCVKSQPSPSSSSSSSASLESLEALLFDSLFEIVRSIRDAPFVQYVFERDRRRPSATLKRVSETSWPLINDVLTESSPDCVILVQKLDTSLECPGLMLGSASEVQGEGCKGEVGGSGEETWGVVVQGKGAGVNACYILKTTQVASAGGRSTHFCITRAQCLGGLSPCTQVRNCWLQQPQ